MDPVAISSLADELSRAFGIACEIRELTPAHGGANVASHFIARTTDGCTYSIKCSTRIAGLVGDRNEYLANRLAELIVVRGASTARRILPQPGLGGAFGSRTPVAIRWSFSGCMPIASYRASIMSAARSFLHQLGCWAMFNTMIGVTDRGEQNLVWDQGSSTLSHVDFEDSFRLSGNLQEQLQYARTYGGLDPNAWRQDPGYLLGTALAEGIIWGSDRLVTHKESMVALMRAEDLDPLAINRTIEWIDLATGDKVTRAKESVG